MVNTHNTHVSLTWKPDYCCGCCLTNASIDVKSNKTDHRQSPLPYQLLLLITNHCHKKAAHKNTDAIQ